MIRILQRFQAFVVKILLYVAAYLSLAFDRIAPSGDSLESIGADPTSSPQEMLVRLTTMMIAGSLTMLALGYSSPVRSLAARD